LTLSLSFHYREAAANILTNDALDPTCKIAEVKVCAVSVEKADEDSYDEVGGHVEPVHLHER